MINDLKPYPAYKDSGVPWLGGVPEHWGMQRAKCLFRKMNRPVRETDEVVTCFRDGIVTLRKKRRVRGFTESLKEIGYQGIRRGDLVIHAMDAFAGAVGVADSDGKGTPVYSVCEPRSIARSHFYAFIVREMARSEWILALAKGIRERSTDFRFDDFASQPVPVPPLLEQAAIARFLDQADRRIQRYIRAKKKLIALLNEQKQAFIHQAVTRGLDPNVRLRPSGVEWLGDVPEHWTLSRLKFEASRIVDCLHATPQYVAEGVYPAIRTADIEPGKLRLRTARKVSIEQYNLWTSRLAPRVGDILYSREGERFGIAALVPDGVSLCISQRMMVFRIRPTQESGFIMWQLNSSHVYAQAAADVIGATSPHVNVERIKNYWIVLPSLREQEQIAASLAAKSQVIEVAVERVRRELELIREYRTRLIADVVTGKLDVREAAALLPEEVEELEPLDEREALAEEDEGGEGGELDDSPEEDAV
jgi:type I restriction enzyme S subunit